MLGDFNRACPNIPFLVDADVGTSKESPAGSYEAAVAQGKHIATTESNAGWDGLNLDAADEESVIALAYTSGTTARPKGVEYTHRGVYMAAMANIIESGLNYHTGRSRYLWTLPMFHAMGEKASSV